MSPRDFEQGFKQYRSNFLSFVMVNIIGNRKQSLNGPSSHGLCLRAFWLVVSIYVTMSPLEKRYRSLISFWFPQFLLDLYFSMLFMIAYRIAIAWEFYFMNLGHFSSFLANFQLSHVDISKRKILPNYQKVFFSLNKFIIAFQ